jgi:hypothetical protein
MYHVLGWLSRRQLPYVNDEFQGDRAFDRAWQRLESLKLEPKAQVVAINKEVEEVVTLVVEMERDEFGTWRKIK